MLNPLKIIQEVVKEVADFHNRITMVTDRLCKIEHYLGLRNHHRTEDPQPYWFKQVQTDTRKELTPRTITSRPKRE